MRYVGLAVFAAFSATTLAGCAHSMMRGSVAMKINKEEAHVCMGDNEVKAGDRVALYRNECRGKGSPKSDGGGAICQKVKLGEGEVTRTLNEHYSVVRVQSGTDFDEGTVVEKL